MKNGNKQEIRNKAQLKARGWNISEAARRIGRSTNHVSLVLRGLRSSKYVTRELSALPQVERVEREVSHV